ncbi:hypothetical protein HKX48_009044 [Thoreauomyces humboldtii]|nr:hypothetical protein HKX48_009044 [Thoreauomyces humboldtii]
MVFLLAAVVSVGQTVFAVGVNVKSVPLMAVGRLVFGVGAESLGVVQTQLTSVHFRTKELALALGVNLSIARLGSVANDLLTPYVGTKYGTVTAVYTALGFCAMSFLCACALAVTSDPSEINAGGVERGGSGSGGGSGNGSGETMTRWRRIWMTVKGYPKAFWLLAACMCLLYATMIPFNTIHAGFLTEKFYPDDPEKAAQLTSIPDTLSAILTPVSGHLTDRYGLRITALASCGCIIAVVHVYLALIPSSGSPIPALAALGAAYALLLTFWPCVALLVGDEASGFAFGMTTAILNVSLTIVPGVVAILVDQDRTYTVTELAFATCAACAVLVTAVVARSREGQRLEDPPSGSGGGSGEKYIKVDKKAKATISPSGRWWKIAQPNTKTLRSARPLTTATPRATTSNLNMNMLIDAGRRLAFPDVEPYTA